MRRLNEVPTKSVCVPGTWWGCHVRQYFSLWEVTAAPKHRILAVLIIILSWNFPERELTASWDIFEWGQKRQRAYPGVFVRCQVYPIPSINPHNHPVMDVRTMPPSYSWPRFLSWSWLPRVSYPLLPGLQKYIISLDPLWNIWRWSYPFPHFLFSKITVLIFYHHCFSDF